LTFSLVDGAYNPNHPDQHQQHSSAMASSRLPSGSRGNPCESPSHSCGEWSYSGGQLGGVSAYAHLVGRITSLCSWIIIVSSPSPCSRTTLVTMMKTKKKRRRRTSTKKPMVNSRTTSWGYGMSPNIIHQCSRRGTFLTCCRMFCMRWEPMFDPCMRQGECTSPLGLATTSLAFMSG
jgi:hypothetical protein